jgi:hypothetical protein
MTRSSRPLRRLFSHQPRVLLALLFVSAGTLGARAAAVADPEPPRITPPRVSMLTGEVSFWRPGAEDWAPARVNTALAAGDLLYSGPDAHIELQIGARAYVRAAGETEIGLENQEPDFVQLKVTGGQAALDIRRLARGEKVEFDAPGAAFSIEQPGYYRVSVSDDTTTFIVRRGGQATVRPADGPTTDVTSGEQVVVQGSEAARVARSPAPAMDAWDRWNCDRTDHLLATVSTQYVSDEIYGADDLDDYGQWRTVPTYGRVWVPAGIAPGWAPYSTGRWLWDPCYGWTWVDDAPWGWAPYHYGRWVYMDSYWAWAPGPVVVTPFYAPALVAFFGGPGFHLGVGIPAISWVALGWGEPVVPWWGSVGFVGRPWWAAGVARASSTTSSCITRRSWMRATSTTTTRTCRMRWLRSSGISSRADRLRTPVSRRSICTTYSPFVDRCR